MTNGKRTYLVQDDEGEFKIVVPAEARVTFGPNVPFSGKNAGLAISQHGYALRVYEGPNKDSQLLAVFCNVKWFRSLSLEVARLVVRESGKKLWKSDEKGYEVEEAVQVDRSFVDAGHLLGTSTGRKRR